MKFLFMMLISMSLVFSGGAMAQDEGGGAEGSEMGSDEPMDDSLNMSDNEDAAKMKEESKKEEKKVAKKKKHKMKKKKKHKMKKKKKNKKKADE